MKTRVTETNYFALDHDVREISESIANKIAKKRGVYAMDPMTIITIANCLIGVIKFLYKCYSDRSTEIIMDMRDPTFFQRILIKREIRKHVDRDMVDDTYSALVEQAKDIEANDIENVLCVYKNNQMFKK